VSERVFEIHWPWQKIFYPQSTPQSTIERRGDGRSLTMLQLRTARELALVLFNRYSMTLCLGGSRNVEPHI
jgi:hypothetical protein